MSRGGFDVVLGNPPYVEYSKVKKAYSVRNYLTEASGNLFAMCGERSFELSPNGRSGLVLPVSAICTDRTSSFQELLFKRDSIWASSFDVFPARLFEGAAQRLAIIIAENRQAAKQVRMQTTAYKRWFAAERQHLMEGLFYLDVSESASVTWIPRLDSSLAIDILKKLTGKSISYFMRDKGAAPIYIHRIINNFVKAVDFAPKFKREGEPETVSPDFKRLHVENPYRQSILSILNSNAFYWYWRCHGDGFHCGFKEIGKFPTQIIGLSETQVRRLELLGQQMSESLRRNSAIKVRNQKKTGRIELQTFSFPPCKPASDAIDLEIGPIHYGLSDVEIDYIVNYDVKYRMGQTDEDDGGEEED
jgi:hypothetical protein